MSAKLRQIAIVSLDPERLARFYEEVFEMRRVPNNGAEAIYLTDGYMHVTLVPNRAEGKPNGLNHFGFVVDDEAKTARRIAEWRLAAPRGKGGKRASSKNRATDPEGNNFNLTEDGFDIG